MTSYTTQDDWLIFHHTDSASTSASSSSSSPLRSSYLAPDKSEPLCDENEAAHAELMEVLSLGGTPIKMELVGERGVKDLDGAMQLIGQKGKTARKSRAQNVLASCHEGKVARKKG